MHTTLRRILPLIACGCATLAALLADTGGARATAPPQSTGPYHLVPIAGDNVTASPGDWINPNQYVQVLNASNQAVPGVVVSFTASGNGALSWSQQTTDGSGYASVVWRASTYWPYTMTACVGPDCYTFHAIIAGGPDSIAKIAGDAQVAAPGGVVSPNQAVRVYGAGSPLGSVPVTFTVQPEAGRGSGVVSSARIVTDASGVAATVWQLASDARLPALVACIEATTICKTFSARVPAITKIAGDNQSAQPNAVVGPSNQAVVVRDGAGAPIMSLPVAFTPDAARGAVVSWASQATDASGQAAVVWALGPAVGNDSLKVSVMNGAVATKFTANGPASLAILAGALQVVTPGQTAPTAPAAIVRDGQGRPINGGTVRFDTLGGGVVSSPTVVSGPASGAEAGVAAVMWQPPAPSAGTDTVRLRASVTTDVGATLSVLFKGILAPPGTLVIAGGDNQTGWRGQTLVPPPRVRFANASGAGIQGEAVTFATADGGIVSPGSVTTDAQGYASANWTLSTVQSADTLRACARGQCVTFHATGTATGTMVLALRDVNPGTSIARDACLTIAAGDGAAYECGDLRLVHTLPATTTMNTTRAPTLLFNSRQATPMPIIIANVGLDPGTQATSLVASLSMTGHATITKTFPWNPAWSTGALRRIAIVADTALATGAYTYTLQVQAQGAGGTLAQATITNTLAIVNRSVSPFGKGWWLDGLEQLTGQGTASTLWIGGDGSTRLYTQRNDSVWTVQPMVDRPDTLKKVGVTWRRLLRNGAFVEFDNAGRHVKTQNRQGHVTTFGQTSTLNTITLPVKSGTAPQYQFSYLVDGAGRPYLRTISAPASAGQPRTVTLSDSALAVTAITGPDATTVSLGYGAAGRLTRRTNRLTDATSFTYDAAGGLTSATLNLSRTNGAGAVITHGFRAAETQTVSGVGGDSLPLLLASVRTTYDGPRTDVPDTAAFYVNRFGAPDTVVNALGQRTRIMRNASFPLLTDTIIAPNGLKTAATYHPTRGLLLTTTVLNPHGTGNAVTTYTWDDTLALAVAVQAPSGVVATRRYDRATRTLVWAQTGGDTTRFFYGAGGLVSSARRVANGAIDSLTYDALGNLATQQTPVNGTTTILRDALGRDSVVIRPVVGSTTQSSLTLYDIAGRDTLHRTTGGSDAHTVQARYDPEGNVLIVTETGSADPNGIGPVTHTFAFDAAGRQVSDSLSGSDGAVRNTFDAAGNLVAGGRNLFGRTTTYDALNRPTQSTGGISTSTFTYDASGGWLQTANNPFAQVSRVYDLGGAVTDDTLRIASVTAQPNTPATNDFTQHQYVITYRYDPSGRRLAMTQPAILGGGTTSYTYDDARTGALATVTDPAGVVYRHHYDLLGRLDSLVRRSGLSDSVPERWTFDSLSRVAARGAVVGADVLYSDGFTYDKQDRVLTAANGDSVTYAPMGHVTYSRVSGTTERMVLDVLGNRVNKASVLPHGGGVNDRYQYAVGTGRLRFIDRSGTQVGDTTFYSSDWLGNTVAESHVMWNYVYASAGSGEAHTGDLLPNWYKTTADIRGPPPESMPVGTLRWQSNGTTFQYDDDNHLIRTDFTIDSLNGTPTLPPGLPVRYDAAEDYRYDALGRRVWVRMLRGDQCQYAQPSSGCLSTVTRTVWDGDHVAGELRVAASSSSSLQGDSDTDGGAFAGVVSYTHGNAVDHPLALRKVSGLTVWPLTDWRGTIGSGVCQSGTGTAARCLATSVLFPLRGAGIFGAAMSATSNGPPSWYGSVIEGMRDGSGKVYQRNRYLDPETGRFTQEDPIGLAGGMNLYGFASGDPVNFSDPFGLCPEDMGGDGKTTGNGDCPKDSKGWNQYRSGAVASAPFSPLDLIPFGAAANSIRGLLTGVATEATSNIAANKLAGDAFRDEIAGLFREAGYGVRTEVGKRTPFGRRVIDIEISRGGNVLGGIETKVGKSPYTAYQRAKDAALYILNNYPVQLVRIP